MTPKKVKPLTGDTKSHSKFEPNMICSFRAILAWKSDDDDDRNSDPYVSQLRWWHKKQNAEMGGVVVCFDRL